MICDINMSQLAYAYNCNLLKEFPRPVGKGLGLCGNLRQGKVFFVYQWSGPGGDAMDVDRSRAPALPLSTEVSEPAPRRGMGRLAALAQNIHDWEDDLSHPTIK